VTACVCRRRLEPINQLPTAAHRSNDLRRLLTVTLTYSPKRFCLGLVARHRVLLCRRAVSCFVRFAFFYCSTVKHISFPRCPLVSSTHAWPDAVRSWETVNSAISANSGRRSPGFQTPACHRGGCLPTCQMLVCRRWPVGYAKTRPDAIGAAPTETTLHAVACVCLGCALRCGKWTAAFSTDGRPVTDYATMAQDHVGAFMHLVGFDSLMRIACSRKLA